MSGTHSSTVGFEVKEVDEGPDPAGRTFQGLGLFPEGTGEPWLVLSRGWAGSGLCFSKIPMEETVNTKKQDGGREMREEAKGQSLECGGERCSNGGRIIALEMSVSGCIGSGVSSGEDAGVSLDFPPEPQFPPL